MPKDENLQLLGATPPSHQPHQREQVPDNEIDERPEQSSPPRPRQQSAEPSEPSAPESRDRVCEPYDVYNDGNYAINLGQQTCTYAQSPCLYYVSAQNPPDSVTYLDVSGTGAVGVVTKWCG
jgi:hypothetical protein